MYSLIASVLILLNFVAVVCTELSICWLYSTSQSPYTAIHRIQYVSPIPNLDWYSIAIILLSSFPVSSALILFLSIILGKTSIIHHYTKVTVVRVCVRACVCTSGR